MFVAIFTDRDLFRVEVLAFIVTLLIAMIGGVSLWQIRRHRWRLRVDHNGHGEE